MYKMILKSLHFLQYANTCIPNKSNVIKFVQWHKRDCDSADKWFIDVVNVQALYEFVTFK